MKGFTGALATRRDGGETSRQDQAELAAYIVEVTGELARLAGDAGLPMLAYFLNLAFVEAQITARESNSRDLRRGA